MTDEERAALARAIDPAVDATTRAYILAWAEHISANARLLADALAGDIVLTGFDQNHNEPTWDVSRRKWLGHIFGR